MSSTSNPSCVDYLIILIMIFVVVLSMACLLADAVAASAASAAPVVWTCTQQGDVMTCRVVRPTARPTATRKPLRPTATPAPAYPAPQTWPDPYPAGW